MSLANGVAGRATRMMWPSVAALLASLSVVAATPAAATARSSYCSPSGDICYGAFGKGATVRLRISLFAHYFTRYRLCVTGPGHKTDCRFFNVQPTSGGHYVSAVRWAKHFPFRGPGLYHARWGWGSGLGKRIDFAEGPSIHVRPTSVKAGSFVRVFGLAGGCPKGDLVTLLSRAFPHTHEFAGVPAVYAPVNGQDSYSTRVRIPAKRRPGKYVIGARCGGGNFGVSASLTVLRP
jgi:hypothetical protein